MAGPRRQLGEPDQYIPAGGVAGGGECHSPAHVRLARYRLHGSGRGLALRVGAGRALRVAVADLDLDVGARSRSERDLHRAEPDRAPHVEDEPGSALEVAEIRISLIPARSP